MKVPLIGSLPFYFLKKNWQIGTLDRHVHFLIAICGNSSYSKFGNKISFPIFRT
jgi:hypothetical protein